MITNHRSDHSDAIVVAFFALLLFPVGGCVQQGQQPDTSNIPTPVASDPAPSVEVYYVDITPSGNTKKSGLGDVAEHVKTAGDQAVNELKQAAPRSQFEFDVTDVSGRPRRVASTTVNAGWTRQQKGEAVEAFREDLTKEVHRQQSSFTESPIVEDLAELSRRTAQFARQNGCTGQIHYVTDGQQFSQMLRQSQILAAKDDTELATLIAKLPLPAKGADFSNVSVSMTLTRGSNENGTVHINELSHFYEMLGTAWHFKSFTVDEQ